MRTAVSGVSALPGRNVRMRCVTIATAFVLLVALTAVDQWQLDRLMAGSLNETQLTWINDTYCNQYLIFFFIKLLKKNEMDCMKFASTSKTELPAWRIAPWGTKAL